MAPACGRDGRSDHRCRRPVDGGRWPPVVGGKRSGVPARQGAHPTGWGRPHRPCRRGCPTSRPVGGGTRWPPVACVQYRRPAGGRGGGRPLPASVSERVGPTGRPHARRGNGQMAPPQGGAKGARPAQGGYTVQYSMTAPRSVRWGPSTKTRAWRRWQWRCLGSTRQRLPRVDERGHGS